MGELQAVILAAGEGKRMHSALPKVLHPLCGRPLLRYILDSAAAVAGDPVIVVGRGAVQVRETIGAQWSYAVQEEQLGTGHALLQALPLLPEEGRLLVLCGDTPLLKAGDLEQLLREHGDNSATVMTAVPPDPTGYGRVLRDADGSVLRIVEEGDAAPDEKKVGEINSGTYCFDLKLLRKYLPLVSPDNVQQEYYLTDVLHLMREQGCRIGASLMECWPAALGINDRFQLAEAAAIMRGRINRSLMEQGVTMLDPSSTYIDYDVRIGAETVLLPQTMIEGESTIGSGCRIGPGVHLLSAQIGDRVVIRQSAVAESVIESGTAVGPFANIRPGCRIGPEVRIGDFVEVKNSTIGRGSKLPHHSYVGDIDIESGVNIGAGVIVANFDGVCKHRSLIREGAFIGCNSNLISPVEIGAGAFVAAGSTVTGDVPAGALAVARTEQKNRAGLGKRMLEKSSRQEKKESGEKE